MYNERSEKRIETIGHYGAILSMVEIGLGSLLHSLSFPFTGFFLSLNQGHILTKVTLSSGDKSFCYLISLIASVLKSLSPAGNKLGPMLSLSMQGILFRIGLTIGINFWGLSLGMTLLCLWGFIQPVLTYYLFFGEKLFNALAYFYQKTMPFHQLNTETLKYFAIGILLLKIISGISLVFWNFKNRSRDIPHENFLKYYAPQEHKKGNPFILALKDLTSPLFLISLISIGLFLYFSQHPFSEMIWYLLRPIAVGLIFFYFSRTMTLEKYLIKLHGGPLDTFSRSCQRAIEKIKKKDS